ncbi:hypothetical protein LCGC14_1282090, partial [marine sediment metagenome]
MYDLWVTRDYMSNMTNSAKDADNIIISDVSKTEPELRPGCCLFYHLLIRKSTGHHGHTISKAECKRRFDFLPRPGECWNVWDTGDDNIYFRNHPLYIKGT